MACGLAMLIMARSLIHSLETTRAEYYQTNHFADIFASLKRAPNDLGARLAALPGVATVQTDLAVPVTLDLPGVAEPASGLVRSLPDFGAPELNRLFLRRGAWLAPGSRGQVLVGEAFAKANALNPGDTLTMLLNGRRQMFRVAGIVLSPEYIFESRPGAALPDSRTYGIFWMPYKEVATAWDLYGAFNHVVVTLAPGAGEQPVIAGLDRMLRPYGGLGAYGRKDHPSHIRVSDEIRLEPTPGPPERLVQAGGIDRLEQVVHRVHLEGVQRVLIERGHEDHVRGSGARRYLARDLEPRQSRHLDVQKDHVGLEIFEHADGGDAVVSLADDLHVTSLRQEEAQLLPRELLVIHNNGTQRQHLRQRFLPERRARVSQSARRCPGLARCRAAADSSLRR